MLGPPVDLDGKWKYCSGVGAMRKLLRTNIDKEE